MELGLGTGTGQRVLTVAWGRGMGRTVGSHGDEVAGVNHVEVDEGEGVGGEGAMDGRSLAHHAPHHHLATGVTRHQETTQHLRGERGEREEGGERRGEREEGGGGEEGGEEGRREEREEGRREERRGGGEEREEGRRV